MAHASTSPAGSCRDGVNSSSISTKSMTVETVGMLGEPAGIHWCKCSSARGQSSPLGCNTSGLSCRVPGAKRTRGAWPSRYEVVSSSSKRTGSGCTASEQRTTPPRTQARCCTPQRSQLALAAGFSREQCHLPAQGSWVPPSSVSRGKEAASPPRPESAFASRSSCLSSESKGMYEWHSKSTLKAPRPSRSELTAATVDGCSARPSTCVGNSSAASSTEKESSSCSSCCACRALRTPGSRACR
mmetsp:Transcript_32145/g.74904  ORF Transcript_32145/g.74904 Transcript_32145/m.74904 type:complete len:243 (-) Transcript_32145:1311-2039(-)